MNSMNGPVASWLVRWTAGQEVWARDLAGSLS